MDVIPSYFEKLRSVAITLDSETVRLQQALKGEESDFEDNAVKIVRDLHSEVQTLKDDVNIVLQKVSLESQDNIDFIKATKVLMKRNSVNIMKIREFFQKYGYNPRDKENSVDEHDIINSKPQLAECDDLQKLNTKDDLSDLPVANSFVAEVLPRSPQLADFGLERYMISQTLPNHPQEVANSKEEPTIFFLPTKQSPATILKTPKCALKMDDFECITPKLEHFSISEYTYLNEDYTMGLKNVESNKSHASEDATGTEPVTNDSIFASPGLKIQRLKKKDAEYTDSPLAPTFCTPGLEIPSTKSSTALEPTDYLLSKRRNPTNNLEGKDCGSLYLNSRECCENLAEPSSPTISSYENLLRTPTPPEVTPIPEDILQILSKYSSNLATPIAVKALPPRKVFPTKREGQNIQDICN